MKLIKFKECNIVFAENQPEYQQMPALIFKDKGEVVSCWKLSIAEKFKILFTGRIWISVLTFNRPLQPLLVMVSKPFKEGE